MKDREDIYRVAYADAIKSLMVKYFNWDTINKEGVWRTRMQKIGQYFRDLDKNVWVDYVAKDIRVIINEYMCSNSNNDLTIFITDCRFDNEVIRIKELFPNDKILVQRLHREFTSNLTKEQQGDVSEKGISSHLVDMEIYLKNREVL